MGRKLAITLSDAQRSELEKGYRNGKSHAFRQRCQMILLKAEGRFSKEIAKIVGIKSQKQINSWVKRYKEKYAEEGIHILHNEPGQGRKQILDRRQEETLIRQRVKQERQRLSKAKDLLESNLNKKFSLMTLKRFLKNLSADSNASD